MDIGIDTSDLDNVENNISSSTLNDNFGGNNHSASFSVAN